MRADALQLFSGNNEVQPKRMGRIGNREQNGNNAGFAMGEPCYCAKRPFRKMLGKVAAGNVAAQRITAATMEKRAAGGVDRPGTSSQTHNDKFDPGIGQKIMMPDNESELTNTADSDLPAVVNGLAGSELIGGLISVDKETAASAEEIIREAIADISEALGITIFPGLENLSLKEIDGDTQEQFAEIVFILKKMVQGFELGRATGMTIETPNATIDRSSIDAVTNILRTSNFKIEIACSILGIADSVQKQVAVKLALNGYGGLLQATDPSTLTMATQHSERIFGNLFMDSPQSNELASLFEKVKKLIEANGGDRPVVTLNNTGSTDSEKIDAVQLDARVYRVLLKIDKLDKVDSQNGEAALDEGKTNLLKTVHSSVQLAKNLSAEAGGEHQENTVLPDIKPGIPQSNVTGVESRITASLMKMADETVMEQITGRLQTILRTGLTEVRLQLRPESLGEVAMRIRIEEDVVQAKIEVQNQQVKEIMERNLPALRDALAQQNLTAGSFDIQINNGFGRHSGNMPQGMWRGEETAQENLHGEEKEEGHDFSGQQQTGRETGRRFGGNSVEYFA